MLTITEYLNGIFEEFEKQCDAGTQDMRRLTMKNLRNNNPRIESGSLAFYSDLAREQLYLLKYAYAYFFEYLSMYNEFIEDFADKEEISVVSLGCGTMLDYWALVCMLEEKKAYRPVVRYLGIDAIKWKHSLETEVRDKDKKTFQFSQETFQKFFNRQDNEFNTYDVYFFPKSISEFSDKKDGISDMELMLKNLSEMKKDIIYFCFSLRKGLKGVANLDVGRVQKLIDKLEEEKSGFRVKSVKCITDTENTISQLKEKGLRVEEVKCIPLGKKQSDNLKNIWDTDTAENIGGYPEIPQAVFCYLQNLKTKCVYNLPQKDKLCEGCKSSCGIEYDQAIIKTKNICDLIIKFERR